MLTGESSEVFVGSGGGADVTESPLTTRLLLASHGTTGLG